MSDTLTRGPEETTDSRLQGLVNADELQKEGFTDETKIAAEAPAPEQITALPGADQAPNPKAPTVETSADMAGVDRMNASANGVEPSYSANRVSEKNILDLRAKNAEAQAKEDTARKAMLEAAAKSGALVYTKGQTPEATTVNHPTPTENSAGEPVAEVKPEKKKRSLLHPSTWL